VRRFGTPPPRPAPLWYGDDFPRGMFGARWPGGRDPKAMACPSRQDRRRQKRRAAVLDTDGAWRLRVATADAYGHRRPA
jgi:hypothetical protein